MTLQRRHRTPAASFRVPESAMRFLGTRCTPPFPASLDFDPNTHHVWQGAKSRFGNAMVPPLARHFHDPRFSQAHYFVWAYVNPDEFSPTTGLVNTCANRSCLNPHHWVKTSRKFKGDGGTVKPFKEQLPPPKPELSPEEIERLKALGDDPEFDAENYLEMRCEAGQTSLKEILAHVEKTNPLFAPYVRNAGLAKNILGLEKDL